jgi:hypothetical protein
MCSVCCHVSHLIGKTCGVACRTHFAHDICGLSLHCVLRSMLAPPSRHGDKFYRHCHAAMLKGLLQ